MEMKSSYNRMTKYWNKEMLYKGKILKSVFRSNVYKCFTGELRVSNGGIGHALTDYIDRIRIIAERLRKSSEWYMIWTDGATEGEKWK